MIDNLIIIIPTHNRHHYLKRVVHYYSSFPCKVYICDSSSEKVDIEHTDNIIYRWVPQSNFYGKVLDVLNETAVDYYALSPDDDFLNRETLIECYKKLYENTQYSFGIGKQVFFEIPFKGNFFTFSGANGLESFNTKPYQTHDEYLYSFWSCYQNVLWSLYKKEAIYNAFSALASCNFSNGNFVELLLGIEGLRKGDVYISEHGLNYREYSQGEHWGNTTPSITKDNINKYPSIREDVISFRSFYSNDGGFAWKCFTYYLDEGQRNRKNTLKYYIKKIIPTSIISLLRSFLNKKRKYMLDYSDKDMEAAIRNVLDT